MAKYLNNSVTTEEEEDEKKNRLDRLSNFIKSGSEVEKDYLDDRYDLNQEVGVLNIDRANGVVPTESYGDMMTRKRLEEQKANTPAVDVMYNHLKNMINSFKGTESINLDNGTASGMNGLYMPNAAKMGADFIKDRTDLTKRRMIEDYNEQQRIGKAYDRLDRGQQGALDEYIKAEEQYKASVLAASDPKALADAKAKMDELRKQFKMSDADFERLRNFKAREYNANEMQAQADNINEFAQNSGIVGKTGLSAYSVANRPLEGAVGAMDFINTLRGER